MASTKKTIIIGSSILVTMGVVAYVMKLVIDKAKKKKILKTQELLKAQSSDENVATQQENAQASSYNPSGDLKLLADYIVGANLFVYKQEVNAVIFKLTDAQLKKLADAWKKKYGESLYYSLDDELDGCGTWGFSNCYASAMARLSKVGKR
jgi:hypothetical protein